MSANPGPSSETVIEVYSGPVLWTSIRQTVASGASSQAFWTNSQGVGQRPAPASPRGIR